MKFISLFTKAPSHQRFAYTPRYYDPKKEEMREREERIKRELERERGIVSETEMTGYRGRIAGSFHAARRRSKMNSGPNVVLLRLAVLLFISMFLFAFLTWGKPVLYSLFIFIPIYFYFKFRKNSAG
jgi:Flp pilus assembly protein TadB